MSFLPFWLLVLIFLAAAGAIWIAGVHLSRYTDVLAERLRLGAALGGLILLAITTNLPELAITVSAAIQGDLSIAVGNILGGIAIQTAVLALLDLIGVRGARSLTYRAGSFRSSSKQHSSSRSLPSSSRAVRCQRTSYS